MSRFFTSLFVGSTLVGIFVAGAAEAFAQSGSRTYPSQPAQSQPAGSALRTPAPQATLALEGYCPVSALEMRKWVKGDPAHQAVYDGRLYRFANAKGRTMFEADPAKYVPALGGDCTVALVEMGKRVPGTVHHAGINGGRLFLFSNAEGQKMFQANPSAFVNADLAAGGNCVVCSVNMRQSVPGSQDFVAIHNGLRYLFPSEDQRRQFLAAPERFVSSTAAGSSTTAGSATRPSAGSGSR
jgi:YHS domain-containing protein